jgi:hypothetical protein
LDRITTSRRLTASTRVREAASEIGITSRDPLGPVIEALASLPEDLSDAVDKLDARLATIADRAEKQAGTKAVNVILGELPRSLDRAFLHRYWWWSLAMAGAIIAALLIGFGAGRYVFPKAPYAAVTDCHPAPQDAGGEAFTCTFWTHPPTASGH